MQDPNALGVIAALASAASWAIGAFMFQALGRVLSPLAMTLMKGVCSLLLLGIVLTVLGWTPIEGRSFVLLAVSGLLGIALGDTLFFRALQGLGALTLLVLAVLGQVLTVVLAVLILGEDLSAASIVGISLVIAGVAAVLLGTSSDDGASTRLKGVLYGLLAVICMSASSIVAKAGLGAGSDTIQATFIRMFVGTLGVFCFGLATRRLPGWIAPFRETRLIGRFVAAVCVITFGGFWLGMVALKYSTVAIASTLTSTEPVFALIFVAVFFRQKVPLRAVLGTVIAFIGIVFLSIPELNTALRELVGRN